MKAHYRLSKLGVKSSVVLMLLLVSFVLVESRFAPIQPAQAIPSGIQYNGPTKYATNYTRFSTLFPKTSGQDWNNNTRAEFYWENATVGTYYELNWFATTWADGWPAPSYLNITSVDFKMNYNAQNSGGTASTGGTLKIYILLGASNTVFVSDTRTPATTPNAYPTGNVVTWSSAARPGGGSWTWEDVRKVRLRVETTKTGTFIPNTKMFSLYEGWIKVNWVKPTHTPTVYIQPPSLVDTAATRQNVTIRPNANGASIDWTGDYTAWDETSPHDGDGTYVRTTSNLKDETSQLSDPGTPSWNISVVRVTVYARSNVTTDENIVPMLVIGGTKYLGTINSLTTSYQKYTSDWGKNPATGKYWTWTEINALEAGVRSYQGGDLWTPLMEIRVTQLYVEVVGPRVEVGVFLKEYVEDIYSLSFSLTFNPDVLNGVWVEQYKWSESKGVPIEIGPAIYNNTVRSTQPLRGIGWNNTVGKLYMTGGAVSGVSGATGGLFCPDAAGRIATLVFEVVGKGETNLLLGSDTDIQYWDKGLIPPGPAHVANLALQNGYFRNVASASMPTASFTKTPVSTPEPMEGYNTTFTDTSTPAVGRSIVTRKWYYWRKFAESLDQLVVSSLPSYTKNYTTRGTWNVTLSVIDDQGVSGTKQGYIAIKAHDVFFAAIYTNATMARYPSVPALKMGQILKIGATAENQGNYTETFSVSTFWGAFDSGTGQMIYGLIGTQAGVVLLAGQKVNVTFYWNTAGRNIPHPDTFDIHANASKVLYEYDTEWSPGKLAPNEFVGTGHRVRHHNVAITDVTTNATAVKIGGTVRVSVTMLNEGDYYESSLTVTAYYGSTVIGTFYIAYTNNRTYSEQVLYNNNYTRTMTFDWDTTGVAYGDYTIKATVTTVPSESDTSDNTFINGQVYVKIPGDADSDRDVDGVDLFIIARCFGSFVGQPRYNPEYDLDDDGDIDGVDLGIFASNYGKKV